MLTRVKMTTVFLAACLLAQFYPHAIARAETPSVEDQQRAPETLTSISLPRKDRLNVISVFRVRLADEIIGHLVLYDNAATARRTDYLEFYDNRGSLLAVSWFDRFGIERVAVDRALSEDGQQLEGGLVLLATGDSI